MSPLIALWIASAIGAVLFFSSGLLLARSGRRVAEPSAERELELATLAAQAEAAEQAHSAELHQLRSALFASEQQQQRLRSEGERAIEQARLHYDRLKEQLASSPTRSQPPSSRREIEELNQRFAQAQKVAASVPTLRSKLGELERALTQTTAAAKTAEGRVRELERELRQLQTEALQKPDLQAKEARILHLESQLGEAQTNLDRLQAQLSAQVDSANAALSNDVKRLNEEQQERALRIKMLTHRVAELEAYAEENAALRGERDGLRGEIARLRGTGDESRALRAEPKGLVDVSRAAEHAKPAQSGTTRRVNDSELTLEFSLKQNLSHLMTREPSLVAVVSDDNGFPVAGVGAEHSQEGVSVLTSLAQELALRVNEFVDLDRIERMELADVTGRALRVRFFDWEAQPLALGCLGKRSLVSNQDEETVVATFPKLLRRAWSA